MIYQGFSSFRGRNQPWFFIDKMLVFNQSLLDPYLISSLALPSNGERASFGMLGGPGVFEVSGTAYGQEGLSIDFGQEIAIENYTNPYDVLSADAYRQAIADTPLEGLLGGNDANTHWIEEVTQPGFSHITFGNIRYTRGDFQLASGISNRNIISIQPGAGFDQFSNFTRARYTTPGKLLTLKAGLFYVRRNAQFGSGTIFHGAVGMNPTFAPDQPLGDFFSLYQGNPKLNLDSLSDRREYRNTSYTAGLELRPIDNLVVGSDFSVSEYSLLRFQRQQRNVLIEENSADKRTWYKSKTYVQYDLQLSSNLLVTPLVYVEAQQFTRSDASRLEGAFNPPLFRADTSDGEFGTAAFGYSIAATGQSWSVQTHGKFEDAANFGADVPGAFFFGARGHYRPFNWLSVHTSYSSVGNYPLISGYSQARISQVYNGPDPTDFEIENVNNLNADLKWEEIRTLEVGTEMQIFEKLSLTLRYWQSNVSELIDVRDGIGPPLGPELILLRSTPTPLNFGELINRGFGIELHTSEISIGKIQYQSSSNFNIRAAEWRSLEYNGGDLDDSLLPQTSRYEFFAQYQLRNNASPSAIYLPRFTGVAPDGSWALDYGGPENRPETFPQAGDGLPSFYFGSTHSFTMQGWRLEFMLDGALGHSNYNHTRNLYQQVTPTVSNYLASYRDLEARGITDFGPHSDFYLEPSGFVRINYLSFGKEFLFERQGFIKRFDVRLAVNNLATFTSYSGADPAVRLANSREENYQYFKPGADFEDGWLPSRIYSLRFMISY
jgi:iron complex outermembrane receptor protein